MPRSAVRICSVAALFAWLLLGPTALVTATDESSGTTAGACAVGRVRPDVKDMSVEQRQAFVDAVHAMKAMPSPYDARYTYLRYVRFYAYLHGVMDRHLNEILDALDRNGLTEDAIIFRTADHGEHGLAHGLREKSYTAYEEAIHVPLVISNPRLFPEPATTDALYSHVDLLPTVAALTGAEPQGVGISQWPVITGAAASVQDAVLFTYDDSFLLEHDVPVSHIRAMRTPRWTYAVYYSADGSAFEYELYDDEADPDQMVNLLAGPAGEAPPEWPQLHDRLTRLLEEKRATPEGFDWALAQPPPADA